MIRSMTGYASGQGTEDGFRWTAELRAVNGKGLDIRLRVPDWIEGLEAMVRAQLSGVAARGNVTLGMRVHREDSDGALALNSKQLDVVIAAMAEAEIRASDAGLPLAPSTAAQIIGLRGVMDASSDGQDTSAIKSALLAALPPLIDAFQQMKSKEGEALEDILTKQLEEIERLTDVSDSLLEPRAQHAAEALRRNLSRVLENVADLDEARLAQELAVAAVKSDVTEEIDRLRAHISAAKSLLSEGGAVGRKLDFLCQEFNREANTLCSKSQMPALTEAGLALKVVIDQMREQIQNVE